MRVNMVGAFIRNSPFGTEIAFQKGLEQIGVSVNTVDTSYSEQHFDHDADATIVFKWMEGNYWDALSECRGPKIVYQPDDLRFPHIQHMMREMRKHCDYALTFDDSGAKLALDMGYADARSLLLTADPSLYRRIEGTKKDIDLCFIGSLTNGENHKSRVRMIRILQSVGLRVFAASDVYDIEKIVQIYNRSRIVLNHATDVGQPFGQGFGYQCRHFEAGFTGACVVSNSVPDRKLTNFVQFKDQSDLIELVIKLSVMSCDAPREIGEMFYRELNESHRPEHRAVELLDFINTIR